MTTTRGDISILTVLDSRGRGSADYITEALPDEIDNVTIIEYSKGGVDLNELLAKFCRQTRTINRPVKRRIEVLLEVHQALFKSTTRPGHTAGSPRPTWHTRWG